MFETVSVVEIIRVIVGAIGMIVTSKGRSSARGLLTTSREQPFPAILKDRSEAIKRIQRLDASAFIQAILFWIHVGFVSNAVVNMFYPSAGIEQLNVASSNLLQILTPLALIVISSRLSARITLATSMDDLISEHKEPIPEQQSPRRRRRLSAEDI